MLCRLCVNECSDFIDIFQEEFYTKITNLISLYFTFKVSLDDEKPTNVCRSCFDSLCSFDSFRQSVEIAQLKWQNILEPESKEDIVETIKTEFAESNSNDDTNWSEENHVVNDHFSVGSDENELLTDEKDIKFEVSEIQSQPKDSNKKSGKSKVSQRIDHLIAEYSQLFCNECQMPMTCFRELNKHFRVAHNKPGYMVCCKRKFFRAADLADHINLHLKPDYFKCDQCEKNFSARYSLEFHKKTCHDEQNNTFKCKQCSRKFLSLILLNKHEKTHASQCESDDTEHLCTDCGKSYPNEKKLKVHILNVHKIAYNRICHLCGKRVRGDKALQQHQSEHMGNKPMVKCHICNAELSTKGNLKAHMIALHPDGGRQTFVCNICGKIAPSQRALKNHIEYVHKCERTHKCNLCDKSFKKSHALVEHYAIHTGDRLYGCPHCDKTFKVRANMHHHRKLKHPIEFEENRGKRIAYK